MNELTNIVTRARDRNKWLNKKVRKRNWEKINKWRENTTLEDRLNNLKGKKIIQH